MSIAALLRSARHRKVRGRPLTRARARSRRDPKRFAGQQTSDAVWGLVDRMMHGDTDAAVLLNDVIEEGVHSPGTIFVKITRKAWTRKGHTTPEQVKPGRFAAVTPGKSIVLFGVSREYDSNVRGGVLKGYLRRFMIGDTAQVGGLNLDHMGPIKSITSKRVIIGKGEEWMKRGNTSFDFETFDSWNKDFNEAASRKRNREWTD